MSTVLAPRPRGTVRHWSGPATLVSCALLLSSTWWCPAATWVLCIAAGSTSLVWLCRRASHDPWLGRLALGSYALRTLLTLALFVISVLGWPIFERVQRGQGFWQIGADGIGYHEAAIRMLDAWRLGVDLPSVFHYGLEQHDLFKDFALLVALLYRLLGPFLLHALLVNAWLGALAVVPGYVLVRTLADRRGARLAAALIGFWPSSLIWSTQLLKDPLAALAFLAFFCCLALLWRGDQQGAAVRWWVGALSWAGVAIAAAVVTFLRNYMGYLLFASLGVVMGLWCVRHVWHRDWRRAARAVFLITVVGIAVRVAASTDFLTLCSPRGADVALVRLGARYELAGDLERAMLSYMRAFEFRPDQALARQQLKRLTQRFVDVDSVGPLRGEGDVLLDSRGQRVPIATDVSATPAQRDARGLVPDAAESGDLPTFFMRPLKLNPERTVSPRPLRALIGEALEARRRLYERGPASASTPAPAGSDRVGPDTDVDPRIIARATALLAVQPPAETPPPAQLSLRAAPAAEDARIKEERVRLERSRTPVGLLDNYRQGMIRVGGHFAVDKKVKLLTVWDVLWHLPRAFMLAFLSPFPTQWFDTSGETGPFRLLSSIEVVLLVILLPGMLFACGVLVRRHGEVGQTVVAFSLLAAAALSLVIINVGILFRLRLQYILPLLAAIGISGFPAWYHRVARGAANWFVPRGERVAP